MELRREWGLGVIGCGRFARFALEALAPLPGLRLAALASRRHESLEAAARAWSAVAPTSTGASAGLASGPRFHTQTEELLTDPAVDIVLVMTPPHLHHELARAVVRAGRHLFLEKPGGLYPEQLAEVSGLARTRGVAATLDFVMRYNPLPRLVKVAVDQGILGPLERADFTNEAYGDLPPEHWFWDPARSGGILVEHGVHFFDLVNWLAGPGQAVTAAALPHRAGPAYAPERVLAVAVHCHGGGAVGYPGNGGDGGVPGGVPGGVLATYYHAFTRPQGLARASLRLTFQRGFINLCGWIPERLELNGGVSPAEATLFTSYPGAAVTLGEGGHIQVRIALPDRQGLYREAIRAAFTDLLQTAADPAHRSAVILEDGVAALRLARAATEMVAHPGGQSPHTPFTIPFAPPAGPPPLPPRPRPSLRG